MYQILQEIDSNPLDKTKATLIFANVTEADILLRKEFEGKSLSFDPPGTRSDRPVLWLS